MTTGEPLYSRALFGSIRDVKTLVSVVDEMKRKKVVLVADRGFYSEIKMGSGTIDYGVPAKLEKFDIGLNLNLFPILRKVKVKKVV